MDAAAAPAPASGAPVWRPKHNPWAIAITVTLATFMEVLDMSIANVSLPHIAGNLSVGQEESTWVLTSYLVSNAVVLPISGWLANKLGRKRFYMTSVALFILSSLLCGLAPSLGWLVFFRVLQGMGGGGLAPVEQSILVDTFPPEKRGMAVAMYGMTVVLAPAIGPTLGGFITDSYSWRWIFFINVPIGILSLYLTNRLVEDPPHAIEATKSAGSLDWIGLLLIGGGLASLEVVFDRGHNEDWLASSFICFFAASAAVLLIAACIWEWHRKDPIVDLKLFRDRSFAACNLLMLVLGLVLFSSTMLMPQFLQTILGFSATDSGEVLSPGGITMALMMPIVGIMVARLDARKMAAFGFVVVAISLLMTANVLSTSLDFKTAVTLRMIQAVGLAFLFVPINTLAYSGMTPQQRNSASGIVNLSRAMGGDVGIALVTTVIARNRQVHQTIFAEHTTRFDHAFTGRVTGLAARLVHSGMSPFTAEKQAIVTIYRGVQRQAAVLAYIDSVSLLATLAVCMLPVLLLVRRVVRPAPATLGH
jgi:DHA2 family multidrug resistance protein